ncbi:MAG: DNA repair protein RadA, partial [Oscillospiraceae bacterium]|nr:DNA repair protein RadA [Oscillospiraceae bacterium]
EIRSVSNAAERIRECARMGFSTCIIPKPALNQLNKGEDYGISIIGAANLAQTFGAAKRSSSPN